MDRIEIPANQSAKHPQPFVFPPETPIIIHQGDYEFLIGRTNDGIIIDKRRAGSIEVISTVIIK